MATKIDITQHDYNDPKFAALKEIYKTANATMVLVIGNTPLENWLAFEIELGMVINKINDGINQRNLH